nr:unnamed protein product [Callosobruchus chinensis]
MVKKYFDYLRHRYENFKGYSTRHAATSAAARAGLNIEIIRETTGWTKNSELELLEEKLQATSVHRGLPRCSTPIRKPKYQPIPTSSVQDEHSRFARQLEYTGVAPKLRGSGTRITGVLSGHLVIEKLQGTLVYKGLPSCSTPIKSKCQPMPTSNEQDDYSRFVKRLECTGMAPKLRGSETPIRGLAMLMALTSAHRLQSFSLIKIQNILVKSKPVEIRIPDKMKTSGKSKSQPILHFPFFIEKPQLCVSSTICHYLEVTKTLRSSENTLILTIKKPHRAA